MTAPSFPRPTHFQFPQPPLSPPETSSDAIGPASAIVPGVAAGNHELRPDYATTVHSAPAPGARVRKTSSLAYHNSGFRESHERAHHRAHKALVVVIPPVSLTQEHGQLGHTLSFGPSQRLSQGIIMPLFSTMYGQLTAIAREFHFPSTTGLCLYLHFSENGVVITPRISDESWPLLWSHVFEASHPPTVSISGRIEFDIDVRQARWYAPWISSFQKDSLDSRPAMASALSLQDHSRGGSGTTFHSGQTETHDDGRPQHAPGPSAQFSRHVPRKLSLVDRYDVASNRSASHSASRALSPPEQAVASSSQTLSPIFQEEEPKSASQILENKVESWRASAILKPTPLAATGQTSLEPANMPNTLLINDSRLATPDTVLDLTDFDWSVTSAGPDDADDIDPTLYLVSDTYLPSPDIAHRCIEDVPPTPSTATSWGAPSPLPSPLAIEYRTPQIDIAERIRGSRPVTPSTATTWGAPLSFPPSPITPSFVTTPDLGYRILHDSDDPMVLPHLRSARPWAFSWPYYSSANAASDRNGELSGGVTSQPWSFSWPYYGSSTTAMSQERESGSTTAPWTFSWPYYQPPAERDQGPWEFSWPYHRSLAGDEQKPWAFSWPYHTASRAVHRGSQESSQPLGKPWAFSWPYHNSPLETSKPIVVRAASSYPRLVLYPPVYSHFDLYPSVALEDVKTIRSGSIELQTVNVHLPATYPTFRLYPSAYPENLREIYPLITLDLTPKKTTPVYPFFDLYPAVGESDRLIDSESVGYPHFDLYPPVKNALPALETRDLVKNLEKSIGYPDFILYPPSNDNRERPAEVSVRLQTYPVFNLYPAVYPHFDIYPSVMRSAPTQTWNSGYPDFVLYPPVLSNHPIIKGGSKSKPLSVHITSYPVFDLYPALYPFIEVYPSRYQTRPEVPATSSKNLSKTLSVKIQAQYPAFDLYPAVYPHFELWPPIDRPRMAQVEVSTPFKDLKGHDLLLPVKAQARYPAFDLYPAVYPHFELYPSVDRPVISSLPTSLIIVAPSPPKSKSRLTHAELHAIVMMEKMTFGEPSDSPITPHHEFPGRGMSHRSFGDVSPIPNMTTRFPSMELLFEEPFRPAPLRPIRKSTMSNWPPTSGGSAGALPSASSRMPWEDDHPPPVLRRAVSMRSNSNDGATALAQPRPPPKKRDSLIAQRMKALNLSQDGFFPPPPLPAPRVPLPPQPLNRSKYPFAQ